jgi:hypothetical protein
MRIPICESKLIKTLRFESEDLDKIERFMKIVLEKATEARQDPPSGGEVIRMLVRLGIDEFYRREEQM